MSSSLKWIPIIHEEGETLPDRLKFILRDRDNETMVDVIFDSSDISYLQGLRDAGIEGAAVLIAAIKKHGEVKVKEHW